MIEQRPQGDAMPASRNLPTPGKRRAARPGLIALLGSALAVLALVAVAAAAGGTRVVSAAANQQLGSTVVVEAHGHTLYALSPETTHHLLCKSATCLQIWPPLTVRSSTLKLQAGPGVQGHLGLLHRAGGKWQVTLRGMPLYRFTGDTAKGQANGEGLMSFGGTWHAVTSSSRPAGAPTGESKPAPSPSPAPSPYEY
jgi:predicted lipoprotein with Yx(FWY)xxD motif